MLEKLPAPKMKADGEKSEIAFAVFVGCKHSVKKRTDPSASF